MFTHLRSGLEQLDELTLALNPLDRRGEGLAGIYVLANRLAALADVAAASEAMIASELAQLPAFCRDVAANVHTLV
ncbi:MAG: hypothetical protein EHM55_24225 [Acidobacteria bacterium]|nr:MAG: hypothetical protein EHM55_24225 [Acidobacteriota bacterium]